MAVNEVVDPRTRAHRRLFLFVVANLLVVAVPAVIDWIPLGQLRVGVTATVLAVGALATPLVLGKIRKASANGRKIAAKLSPLALIYAGLLALIAFVELPFELARLIGTAASTAFVLLTFTYSWWGMPDSLKFWHYPSADQA